VATVEERRAFGRRVRQLREAKDWSLDELAERMAAAGQPVTASNIGAWERGQYAPRKRATLGVLERVLDGQSELAPVLGMTVRSDGDPPPELSASGADLDELRRLDPEAYEQIIGFARLALDRARQRRRRR
jgi:transcriptional regulator with XRE-family HTH domain